MNTIKCIIFFLCISFSSLTGQIAKGDWLLGGNADFSYFNPDQGNSSFSMNLNPNLGYFVNDNVAIGGNITLGVSSSGDFNTTTVGIGGFARYYFSAFSETIMPFATAGLGYLSTSTNSDFFDEIDVNGLNYTLGIGVSYFLAPSVALEGILGFDSNTLSQSNFDGNTTVSSITLGVGFQVFFSKGGTEE